MARSSIMCDWARLGDGKVSAGELQCLLGRGVGQAGFDEYIFVPREGQRMLQLSSSGADLIAEYERKNFAKVDPIHLGKRLRRDPIVWDARDYLSQAGEGLARELWDAVLTFGYRYGVSVPLHGPHGRVGMLTCLSRSVKSRPHRRHVLDVMVSATLADTFYGQNGTQDLESSLAEMPELSERETECLHWTSLGKTAWEVGRILKLSTRTVNFHLQKSMRKLNAESKHQACYIARNIGLLDS